MKIAMLWHDNASKPETFWSCPLGLSYAFKRLGHYVYAYYFDAGNCNLEHFFVKANEYEAVFVSWPWTSPSLDAQIKRLREISHAKVILELGDEPQTFGQAMERIKYVNAAFTPDLRCQKKYKEMGYNVHWLNHWGDEFLFYYNENIRRSNVCITTCGKRPGVEYVQSALGDKFINKRIPPQENNDFYNSGTVAYQYANNDEITRRIFEAGGCKLAVVTNRISTSTGIYDLFIDGRDIMYYSNPKEAAEKIEYLLNNDYIRNALAENIYKKVQEHHRAETRAKQIVDIIKSC
jgi:hypothetical protein